MIASPSDVAEERDIVTNALYQWNNANAVTRELMLQPVKWETHSSPQMGAPAQAILNTDILLDADIVIGIFGTRIGTATVDFISGSVEEIKRHVAAGKLAMLYFSNIPVNPNAIDQTQWSALKTFKAECQATGLYAEYGSYEQLRTDFGHHLTLALNKPQYLWMKKPETAVELKDPELNNNDIRLLLATSLDTNGQILTGTTMAGFYIQTNHESFVEDTPRSAATWKRVLSKLEMLGYLDHVSEEIYELTEEGFDRAEVETGNMPLEVSCSLAGEPGTPALAIKSNKPVKVRQIEFITTSEIPISAMNVESDTSIEHVITLDYPKITELFATPRSDMNPYDHSGPFLCRIVLGFNGRRNEVLLPVMLTPKLIGNAQKLLLSGAKVFELKSS